MKDSAASSSRRLRWSLMGFLIFVIGTGQAVALALDDRSGGQPSNGRVDLESRARSVLAQADLRIEGTSSGAVCIRDDDGEMIGLAAIDDSATAEDLYAVVYAMAKCQSDASAREMQLRVCRMIIERFPESQEAQLAGFELGG